MATTKKRGTPKVKAKKQKVKAPYAAVVKKAWVGVARNRKKAEGLVELVQGRLSRIERDFHAVGVALNQFSATAMYSSLGYDSFVALLKGENLLRRTTAYPVNTTSDLPLR